MTVANDSGAILTRIRKVAATTFGCGEGVIDHTTTAADVNGWDSLSHAMFILGIEREFCVRLDLARVLRFENVGDLVREIARLMQ